MKLSSEQIRSVAVGAVRWEDTPQGTRFCKCTQKQVDAWAALRPVLGERALATTGIRLDFHTNSKTLRFETSAGGHFELWLDGQICQKIKVRSYREENRPVEVALTDPLGGEKDSVRVTLCFPSHSLGVISSLELDDGATLIPHRFDKRLLFIGDSITQGYDSHYDSLSYAYRVSRFFNAESVIHGVGGGVFHETVFDRIDFDPDAVIIAFGTNDFGFYKTAEEFRARTEAFLGKIAEEYRGRPIFVISPIWRAPVEKPMGSFRDAQRIPYEVAEKLHLIPVDGLTLVPPNPDFFKEDLLHPNSHGFSLYAESLIREMLRHL